MSANAGHGTYRHSRVLHIRGGGSDAEIAALTVVLAGLAGAGVTGAQSAAGQPSAAAAPRSAWADPAHRLRAPLRCGPDAWRASALPG